MIQRLFGPLKELREADLEAEHLERVQGEVDRHARWMDELRESIRDHWKEEPTTARQSNQD